MQKYNDIDHDSNIDSFEIGDDYIKVKFINGPYYTYTYNSAGIGQTEEMKRLALAHDGLNAYISRHRPRYSKKNL